MSRRNFEFTAPEAVNVSAGTDTQFTRQTVIDRLDKLARLLAGPFLFATARGWVVSQL
jgi:hypothetical protein